MAPATPQQLHDSSRAPQPSLVLPGQLIRQAPEGAGNLGRGSSLGSGWASGWETNPLQGVVIGQPEAAAAAPLTRLAPSSSLGVHCGPSAAWEAEFAEGLEIAASADWLESAVPWQANGAAMQLCPLPADSPHTAAALDGRPLCLPSWQQHCNYCWDDGQLGQLQQQQQEQPAGSLSSGCSSAAATQRDTPQTSKGVGHAECQ
ncbi:hypothetical protein N2152v2_010431 [Parachlorella kessleri]